MKRLLSIIKNLFKKSSKGFTLIELLVVIGILGVLASALVATIDPFEQIKKGDDAVLKNVATEFQTAGLRYYTTHGTLPWDPAGSGGAACNGGGLGADDPVQVQLSTWETTCLDTLTKDRELKEAFKDFKDLEDVYVTEKDNNISVCFKPTSSSQRKAPTTKYTQAGDDAPVGTCPSQDPEGGNCYYCAK